MGFYFPSVQTCGQMTRGEKARFFLYLNEKIDRETFLPPAIQATSAIFAPLHLLRRVLHEIFSYFLFSRLACTYRISFMEISCAVLRTTRGGIAKEDESSCKAGKSLEKMIYDNRLSREGKWRRRRFSPLFFFFGFETGAEDRRYKKREQEEDSIGRILARQESPFLGSVIPQ